MDRERFDRAAGRDRAPVIREVPKSAASPKHATAIYCEARIGHRRIVGQLTSIDAPGQRTGVASGQGPVTAACLLVLAEKEVLSADLPNIKARCGAPTQPQRVEAEAASADRRDSTADFAYRSMTVARRSTGVVDSRGSLFAVAFVM